MKNFKYNHGSNIKNIKLAIEKYQQNILDFSVNINPLGFPTNVKNVLIQNINSIVHYPDPECRELKSKLSKYLGVNTKNILVGNGSTELIFGIIQALRPQKALIIIPTFSEYEKAVSLVNGKCIFVKFHYDFTIEIKDIINYLPEIDFIFICNPNNPTGYIFPKDDMLLLTKLCKKYNITILIDESFIDFTKDAEDLTMIKIAITNPNVLVLRSFTKFFAIPGLRLGYLVANKKIKDISKFLPVWSVNHLAQLAGIEVLKDTNYIKYTKQYILREQQYLYKKLSCIKKLNPYYPTANFIFCKLTQITSTKLTNILCKKGILIRDCSNFRGLNNFFIRIAIKKREENKKLLKTLQEILCPKNL